VAHAPPVYKLTLIAQVEVAFRASAVVQHMLLSKLNRAGAIFISWWRHSDLIPEGSSQQLPQCVCSYFASSPIHSRLLLPLSFIITAHGIISLHFYSVISKIISSGTKMFYKVLKIDFSECLNRIVSLPRPTVPFNLSTKTVTANDV
jgi:hypothetical protein